MFFEDASAFTADFGSPVILKRTGAATMALFDQPDEDVLSGRVQSRQYSIQYPASDLVGLSRGDVLLAGIGPGWSLDSRKRLQYNGPRPQNADSGEFRVRSPPELIDDGLFMRVDLERV